MIQAKVKAAAGAEAEARRRSGMPGDASSGSLPDASGGPRRTKATTAAGTGGSSGSSSRRGGEERKAATVASEVRERGGTLLDDVGALLEDAERLMARFRAPEDDSRGRRACGVISKGGWGSRCVSPALSLKQGIGMGPQRDTVWALGHGMVHIRSRVESAWEGRLLDSGVNATLVYLPNVSSAFLPVWPRPAAPE